MKKSKKEYTYQERQELASNKVTLDGKPALIIGLRNPFATVKQYPTGCEAEFAWATVEHIIKDKEGKFKS